MMKDRFSSSWLKIKRANKHISDIYEMMVRFSASDFHTIKVEHDAERGTNFLCFEVDMSMFPMDESALTIGDGLHNLRSALDHLYFQVVLSCGGKPTKWTRFPICDTREHLVAQINSALEKKQITADVGNLILDSIKPYKTGNPALWGLHEINIRDKHEIIIPVLKLIGFFGVALEDDQHLPVGSDYYIMDESSRIRLRKADDRKVTIKDKGRPSANILFDIGTSFAPEAVFPALKRVSEEVARTVRLFEDVCMDGTHV
jgi:hypothetical protein